MAWPPLSGISSFQSGLSDARLKMSSKRPTIPTLVHEGFSLRLMRIPHYKRSTGAGEKIQVGSLVLRFSQITRLGDRDHSPSCEIYLYSRVTCGIVVPPERCVLQGAEPPQERVHGP